MINKIFYRRRLPHFQPSEAFFSITYRLAGSLPKSILQKLSQEYDAKRLDILQEHDSDEEETQKQLAQLRDLYFLNFEYYLDQAMYGPTWLKEPQVAQIVMDSLRFIEQNFEYWTIWAFCIMSNHVHLECSLKPEAPPLFRILQRHKSFTAIHSNRILNRSGPFWQEESFDRLIRNEAEFYKRINYAIDNPVKAGLVKDWSDWPYTYVHSDIGRAELKLRQLG